MKPEELVPLKETCQNLKEAGIEFDSHFGWDSPPSAKGEWEIIEQWITDGESENMIPAPTAQELLEKLPIFIRAKACNFSIDFGKDSSGYYVQYIEEGEYCTEELNYTEENNLAEALAEMLLWLHKEGHLK